MTNEEAIRILKNAPFLATSTSYQAIEEAVEVAIKALNSTTDCSDCIKHGGDYECDHVHCHKGRGGIIYRQDAIDAVTSLCDDCDSDYCGYCRVNIDGEKDARKVLKDLPSAQAERPKGHWKLDFAHNKMTCSECGRTFDGGFDMDSADNFCRHCGSDNRG